MPSDPTYGMDADTQAAIHLLKKSGIYERTRRAIMVAVYEAAGYEPPVLPPLPLVTTDPIDLVMPESP